MTSYNQEIEHIKTYTAKIAQAIPETMRAFYALSRSSSTPGALDTKTKELMALAIGVASHCDGCIAFHTRGALQAGATSAEIMETLSVAIAMGGGPSLMYASHVVEAMEEFQNSTHA
jgi:AhpD family alkylhydroperoxidase